MMPTTIMNENMFTTTPVVTTSQSRSDDLGSAILLAPRPSATLLPPEALSLGPSFPCLDSPPYFPHDLLRSEGDQGGDGRSKCHRGRCYIQKSREQRGRTPLAPPARIRLRPRFSGYTTEITNLSAVSTSNATSVVSLPTLEEEPSRKHRVMESPAVKGDMQLMQCSCLFDGQENQSSFPRAA